MMSSYELLMRLWEKRNSGCDHLDVHFALDTVVEYLQDWESWQETWAGDMPMTIQQEARRVEREKLVKEITAIIEGMLRPTPINKKEPPSHRQGGYLQDRGKVPEIGSQTFLEASLGLPQRQGQRVLLPTSCSLGVGQTRLGLGQIVRRQLLPQQVSLGIRRLLPGLQPRTRRLRYGQGFL